MSAACTIQDVFNRFYPEYTKTHELSAAQRKAAYHAFCAAERTPVRLPADTRRRQRTAL